MWNAALKHASLSEASVRLILLDGEPPHQGQGGFFQAAGQYLLPADAGDVVAYVDQINEHPELHRVGLWRDYPPEMAAGLIRHELEHLHQYQLFGMGVFRLHDAIKRGIFELTASGIGGAHVLINASPLELDANAAGARFVKAQFTAEAILAAARDYNGAHEVLFRYPGPSPSRESLPRRLVRFGSLFVEACEAAAAREGLQFAEVLETRYAGAGAWWCSDVDDYS
jgi:hypothetical protein